MKCFASGRLQATQVAGIMPVLEIENLTKDFSVGFWKKHPVRALDTSVPAGAPGGDLRLSGPEWSRQKHDHQNPDASAASDFRNSPDTGSTRGCRLDASGHRISAGKSIFLRLPDSGGTADLYGQAFWIAPARSIPKGGCACSRASG